LDAGKPTYFGTSANCHRTGEEARIGASVRRSDFDIGFARFSTFHPSVLETTSRTVGEMQMFRQFGEE
jgi:hypothetical protein